MMNIRNLGLQERVGVKYIDDRCAKFCLKLWFESDWYFCNITTQMFFKIGVLKNFRQLF